MPTDPWTLGALAALVLLSAVLYSSVGHAGASAYIAALTLFGVSAPATRPAALVLNIFVALVGSLRFSSAGLVPWRLIAPLCAGSVPAAFLGGVIQLPLRLHGLVLGLVLLFGAGRLWFSLRERDRKGPPAGPWLIALGTGIGFLAGLTGVGGGIFLSPLMILTGWEDTRRTAGASVVFILVNSVAGLLGHLGGGHAIPEGTGPLAVVAVAGGLYGSWLGARRLAPLALRRILAVVLVIAGGKLLLTT